MRFLPMLAGISLLAGCASAPGVQQVPDLEYMKRVEHGAALGGAHVYWVQPPTRPEPTPNTAS